MIDELEMMLPEYPGRANHARCFLHTTNLIAKSLLRIFDVDKKKKSSTVAVEIEELSEDSEADEQAMATEIGQDADDVAGLIDLVAEMDPQERVVHEERMQTGLQDHKFHDNPSSCLAQSYRKC
jgi:hypothetical protein